MAPTFTATEHLPPAVVLFPALRIVQDAKSATVYKAYFTRALADKLNLRAGQAIDLLPPSGNHFYWYLDLRPHAQNRLNWYADTRPRIQRLCMVENVLEGSKSLTLRLVPGDPPYPNYYPLLPEACFTPKC